MEETMNDVDLAKEMNELSFEQREKILEDVHGVAAVHDETPEFVDQCIEELDKAISKTPIKNRKAYNRAVFLRPSLQSDKKFKLQFLRADEFDAKMAAERMVKYFQQKSDLFGEEKLGKTLTLDDLTDDDMYLYEIGYITVLPFPDRSGRPIIFGDGTKLDFERMTIDSILRCYWYLMVSCYDDEIAQKKGSCTVVRLSAARRSVSKLAELARRSAYNANCAPGRNASFHICYDDSCMDFLIKILRFSAEKATRVRTRAHFGSEIENDYKLMSFGIPCDSLLQKARRNDFSMFEEYIRNIRNRDRRVMQEEEREEAETGVILYPKPKDVLIGRGKSYRDLPCNVVWDVAMQHAFERFRTSSTQFEKTCISMEVVKSVQDTGSRFLQRDPDGWRILDDVAARQKTSVGFRNRGKDYLTAAAEQETKVTRPHLDSPDTNGQGGKRPRLDEPIDQMM